MKRRSVYTIDGQRVPGVTSLIGVIDKSAALVPWASRMACESIRASWSADTPYKQEYIDQVLENAKKAHSVKKTDAGAAGTDIHELVGAFIEGQIKLENLEAKDRLILDNFQIVTQGWKWLGSEVIVLNREHLFGGTADALCVLPSGMRCVADWKSSKGVYPSFWLQLAMYAASEPMDERLREEWKNIKEGRILHYTPERCSWEVLEVDLQSQYPYIPAVRKMFSWQREFDSSWH